MAREKTSDRVCETLTLQQLSNVMIGSSLVSHKNSVYLELYLVTDSACRHSWNMTNAHQHPPTHPTHFVIF